MIDYFIIGHNSECFNAHNLESAKYLLVGPQTSANTKHIDCKALKNNLEDYPFLCSYTAWFAIAKNNLFNNPFVSMIEYDTKISSKFHSVNLEIISNQKQDNNFVIAYSKTLTDHYVFYKSTPWLELTLKKIYNIDLRAFVESNKQKHPFWPTTTNITAPQSILLKFVEWFDPISKYIRSEPLGSYVHERAFFVFCVINNIDIVYPKYNVLQHQQLCSHNNNDIYGQFLKQKNTDILTEDMALEYDYFYKKQYNLLRKTNQ
jgi:hypothetical protein